MCAVIVLSNRNTEYGSSDQKYSYLKTIFIFEKHGSIPTVFSLQYRIVLSIMKKKNYMNH